jgi:hypothetical protein
MTLLLTMNLDFAWGESAAAVTSADVAPLIIMRRRIVYYCWLVALALPALM